MLRTYRVVCMTSEPRCPAGRGSGIVGLWALLVLCRVGSADYALRHVFVPPIN